MEKGYNGSLEILFDKMEDLISSKTIVGDAVSIGDITIVPLIEVSLGVGAGGRNEKSGAGGMGAKIIPSSVIVIQGSQVRLINVKNQDAVNRLIDMVPEAASKLGFAFGGFTGFGKSKTEDFSGEAEADVKEESFKERTVVKN